MMRIVAVFLLSILITAPLAAQDGSRRDADPRFDWFEYTGNDPVYDEVEAGADEYLNPILAGFYPDPSIVRVGEDYYLITSSFAYFPGIPIFHSRDLIHWRQLGHVLDRPSQLPFDGLRISRGIFAPTIRYHDGTFYVICTLVDAGGNFIVTAEDPAGPWSEPTFLPFDGIDPSIFFDEDGRVYITNNGPPDYEPRYSGHRAIWIQEFDPEAQQMVGPREVIVDGGVDLSEEPVWIEAPHLFKKEGTYYLIAAEGGTSVNHSEVVFRSDDVFGPYEPYSGNPILTQRHLDPERPHPVTSAGHADFVELPDGSWWSVFLATRPYADNYYNTGRETFLLPVEWTDDGWPVVTGGRSPVPYVHVRPNLPLQPAPDVPKNGNFTYRDDFDGDELLPYWTFVRTPETPWHELQAGFLTLRARPAPLGDVQAQPSYIGRRQQHTHASASTAMHYRPQQAGAVAGLAAFQNDNYLFRLGVTLEGGAPVVQVVQTADGEEQVLASAPLALPENAPVHLRIDARGDEYDFYYGLAPDDWMLLHEGADGTLLSTEQAGGFVGTTLGPFAFTPRR